MKPKIVAVVGPTASGKSSLGTEIAKKFNGEILCVDSRTVYLGLDVGTAKSSPLTPLLGGEGEVIQHGLDLVNPDEEMNGALFKEYADKVIADILSRGKLPVLVGGTGLWFDMIIDNLEMPEVEPDLVLRAELEKRSEEELFFEFKKLDPVGAEIIDQKNKRRLIRALEVCKKTGQPFSELRKKGEPKYDVLWLGVDWPKNILDERIDQRVDEMIENGLVDEVKNLMEKYGDKIYAMSGIGYQEICRFLNSQISLVEAVEEIKTNTKHYAKRQRTWFKKNKNIHWLTDVSEAELIVQTFLK